MARRKARKFVDVARAGLVVDQSGDHEQRALEQRMGDQIEHRRLDRLVRAEAGQHDQQPERADGRVGKHQLEVGLAQRQHGSDDQRRAAEQRQDRLPRRRAAHRRIEPHHQVDAGLHHGRRVQVGRDRGRRLHGVGQPEMERELRRLGEGAAEHEDKRGEVERAGAEHGALPQQRRHVGRPGDARISSRPASSDRPPMPVTTSAWKAARRAASR